MTPTLNPIARHREHCRETRAQMSDYLDGELDPGAAASVERHVRWCPNCHRMLANLTRTIGGLRALHHQPTPADESQPEG
jgi:anti-sigma factor RsiW